MSGHDEAADARLLSNALDQASDTRYVCVERGARHETGQVFNQLFQSSQAVVVADENTFTAAGRDVCDSLRSVGQQCAEPIIFPAAGLYAESSYVDQLVARIGVGDALPVAVGSGTINDITKLAAHRCGRPYLAVATAASMDGYTAYGASITHHGSKQTFDCPAPVGVIADLDVIARAPEGMNASGYADLVAKCPAGADWMLADALGVEPIHASAWGMVQSRLRDWMADPGGVRDGRIESLRRVTVALLMTGFAMQTARSSRPASGAEHQFSHLWDMEHHTYQGKAPSHGFKVGIGSLASLALYQTLDELDVAKINVQAAVSGWPNEASVNEEIKQLFTEPELAAKAREESAAKYVPADALRVQLTRLKSLWPELRLRLADQLLKTDELRDMLKAAGCPYESEQIGIDAPRLRRSYQQAYHIRRRFTVLDVARRTGLMNPALDRIFAGLAAEDCR
jgi:glycerol-1-phosphate dehydrogenase [NAD(P)+]